MKKSRSLFVQATAIFFLLGAGNAKSEVKPGAWRGQSITEFTESENATMTWEIVNDGVMGGLSDGKLEFTDDDTLKFFGTLSLENNGGFTTARSSAVDLNLSNDLGLLLKVRGDGRKYEARLESDSDWRGMPVSFSGEFVAEKGDWQQIKIPFSSFKGSFRGRDLPDLKLNPADIRRVWILLGDKKEGPFSMEIDWIRTYGKGQGNFTKRETAPSEKDKVTKTSGPKSLIDTAVADGRFTTLKAALDTARLTTFFQWDNKLTVFAPTDEAFAKLPKETLAELLKPESKDQLVKILSYHVASGQTQLADALSTKSVKTIEGSPIEVSFANGSVRVNDSKLLDADILCSDGVIHVIDTVLMPPKPAPKTILSTAKEAGTFQTLLTALEVAGLSEVLEGEGPFTVFAPTDEAFSTLDKDTLASILKKENRELLVGLLKSHVVSGNVSAGDALNSKSVETLGGTPINFAIQGGSVKVEEATLKSADLDGGNGVIHVIDSVLIPESCRKDSDLPSSSCGEKGKCTSNKSVPTASL